MIIFSELYDASPQYPLNDGVIEYFLEEENIDLSVDKLVEMGRSGITTLYKPVQYIQVVKEEHNLVVSPKQNKWDLKYTKEEHYYYRIIGLSTSDLVEHRRSIRDRINKSSAPEQGKKTRIIDILKSCRIDEKNYHWFLVDEKINEKTISETFSILEKNNMIYVLGTRKGEPRYTLQDDLYELLNHCLGITEDVLLMLEKWWEHNYPPDNDAKRWLELFYLHSQVLAMIGSYGKQRQQTSHNKIRIDRKTQELKREAEFALTRHKAQIEYKDAHFEEIINKYSGPLLTAFTQLTTNPLVFRNLLKHIKKMDSVHRQSIWE